MAWLSVAERPCVAPDKAPGPHVSPATAWRQQALRAIPPLGGKRLAVHAAPESEFGGNMKPRIVVVTQSMVDEAVPSPAARIGRKPWGKPSILSAS
ncbi:MAG: hypothetical protein EBU14_10645 [Acetobacteraceae bacterium]|nr:hypothetical protein [Acetobacteraceae bacterium]